MKKVFCLFFSLMLMFSLCGCQRNKPEAVVRATDDEILAWANDRLMQSSIVNKQEEGLTTVYDMLTCDGK